MPDTKNVQTPSQDKQAVKIIKRDPNPQFEDSHIKGPSSNDCEGASGESGGLKKKKGI